jgi:hypothetical protein
MRPLIKKTNWQIESLKCEMCESIQTYRNSEAEYEEYKRTGKCKDCRIKEGVLASAKN